MILPRHWELWALVFFLYAAAIWALSRAYLEMRSLMKLWKQRRGQ